jgi:hypothetical protein
MNDFINHRVLEHHVKNKTYEQKSISTFHAFRHSV